MHKFRRSLIGFTLIIESLTCVIDDTLKLWPDFVKVIQTNTPAGIGANCSHIDMKEFPTDLPADIKVLLLEQNHNLNFRNNSFQRYTELLIIWMHNISIPRDSDGPVYEEAAFLSLTKLALVAMTDAGFSHIKFKFPHTVYVLFISGNLFDDLNISNLLHLQVLYAVSCGLDDIPKLHELAPLSALALTVYDHELVVVPRRGEPNPLRNLTVETLSQFCRLRSLVLNMTLTDPITLDDFCRCSRIKTWISILTNNESLVVDFTAFSCGNGYTESECSFNFTNANANRKACLLGPIIPPAIPSPTSSIPPISSEGDDLKLIGIIAGGILLFLLATSCICYCVWMIMTSHRPGENEEPLPEEEISEEDED